ncbi:hypothetical protein FA13DRAFT_1731279 [Coprinellus micaceus]|uniref:Uncharacterized protein n=1 Tax=Coprinellus micaceus TaxID=71717 RepID=A0A4Y7TFL9_COPMI|nr:hypothetical protein FA13DRAFT_1731279 [Coprinellus micaceus]
MDSNAATADMDLDEGSDRTPSPPHDDRSQEEWDAGRISESATTVRGMPEYVVQELERIQASRREAEGITPTSNIIHDTPPFLMPSTVSGSMLGTSYTLPSMPPSPRLTGADSSALPSPPSSPADSVSSLPSVGSSFFFSSAAASPGVGPERHLSDHEQPEELPQPTHDPPPIQRRRRTIHESSLSSLESSPSSLELTSSHRGSSRTRGVWKPHRHGHYSDAAGATSGLIIPSLALPPALKRPTPYGQTVGEVRLLVLARQGAKVGGGRGFVANLLLEDNDDVVEVGEWEEPVRGGLENEEEEEMVLLGKTGAKVLRASTDWVEHADAHGLEKYEPARNVEVCELPGGTHSPKTSRGLSKHPFRAVSEVLHPDSQPSSVLANLVGSASTPLFTALIILLPTSLTPLDRHIIDSLGPHIPIIVLPASALSRASTSSAYPISSSSSFSSFPSSPHLSGPQQVHIAHSDPHGHPLPTPPLAQPTVVKSGTGTLVLSSFRPKDEVALKHGLFHSPETLARLRTEAAGRFLRWREVERVVRGLRGPSTHTRLIPESIQERCVSGSRSRLKSGDRRGLGWRGWDKEKWEREWMGEFSKDVAIGVKSAQGERGPGAISRASSQSPGGIEAQQAQSDRFIRPTHPPRYREAEREELNEKIGVFEEDADTDDPSTGMMGLTHTHGIDPLHLPSLLFFTVSMLGPLKARVWEMVKKLAWMPFTTVSNPSSSAAASPVDGIHGQQQRLYAQVEELSEKGELVRVIADGRVHVRAAGAETEETKWVAVSGLVGVGFCVGVGVGVVAARSAESYASS